MMKASKFDLIDIENNLGVHTLLSIMLCEVLGHFGVATIVYNLVTDEILTMHKVIMHKTS